MKIKFIFIFLISAFLYFNVDLSFGSLNGGQIIEKTWHKYRVIPKEFETISLLQLENGTEKEKKILRWSQYNKSGEDKITIKFTDPPIDKGLSLLTHRNPDKTDDQWLRMPSWKKVRRVSVSNESKYFAGTDLTYEDVRQLSSERISDFRYEILEDTMDYWVIKAMPKPNVRSGYVYRIFQIKKNFVLIKIEYYGLHDNLIKTQQNKEIQYYKNGAWRANIIEIDNALLNRKTIIRVVERNITPENDKSIFSKMFLLRN
jgi:hypothetical protein